MSPPTSPTKRVVILGALSAIAMATARLYAGAGIMAGSDPAREKAETELKFSAMEASLLDRRAVG